MVPPLSLLPLLLLLPDEEVRLAGVVCAVVVAAV